jgi:hypothetical protein
MKIKAHKPCSKYKIEEQVLSKNQIAIFYVNFRKWWMSKPF